MPLPAVLPDISDHRDEDLEGSGTKASIDEIRPRYLRAILEYCCLLLRINLAYALSDTDIQQFTKAVIYNNCESASDMGHPALKSVFERWPENLAELFRAVATTSFPVYHLHDDLRLGEPREDIERLTVYNMEVFQLFRPFAMIAMNAFNWISVIAGDRVVSKVRQRWGFSEENNPEVPWMNGSLTLCSDNSDQGWFLENGVVKQKSTLQLLSTMFNKLDLKYLGAFELQDSQGFSNISLMFPSLFRPYQNYQVTMLSLQFSHIAWNESVHRIAYFDEFVKTLCGFAGDDAEPRIDDLLFQLYKRSLANRLDVVFLGTFPTDDPCIFGQVEDGYVDLRFDVVTYLAYYTAALGDLLKAKAVDDPSAHLCVHGGMLQFGDVLELLSLSYPSFDVWEM